MNVVDKDGKTAVFYAMKRDDVPTLEILVAGGANVNGPGPMNAIRYRTVFTRKL